jgi:hypothetical protein
MVKTWKEATVAFFLIMSAFFGGTAEHKPVLVTNSIPDNYRSLRHSNDHYAVTFGDIAYPSHLLCFLFFLFIYILFTKTGFSSSLSEYLKSGIPFRTSRMCDDLTLIQEMSNILPLSYTDLEYRTVCIWYQFSVL